MIFLQTEKKKFFAVQYIYVMKMIVQFYMKDSHWFNFNVFFKSTFYNCSDGVVFFSY